MTRDQGWEGSEHYKKLDIDAWDAMKSWLTPEEYKGFLKGCAIKRLARANSKGEELLDITKAIHELQKAKEILESTEQLKVLQSYSWAKEKLDLGFKVRRDSWDPGAYIREASNEKSGRYLRSESGVKITLNANDIAMSDWELYTA